MPSVASLRNTISQQQSDAQSKRKLAEDLMRSADEHAARGDEVRAKLDRDSAERYLRDLSGIENTVAGYEREITKREQKAREIDKRIDDLGRRFEHDLEQLEKEKESVREALLAYSDLEVASRMIKNRSIDHKESELHKHYKRDLAKLEQEKRDLLG